MQKKKLKSIIIAGTLSLFIAEMCISYNSRSLLPAVSRKPNTVQEVKIPLADTIPNTTEDVSSEQMALRVFQLTNIQRANAGVQPLVYSESLSACAEIRAKEIVTCWSHTRPNGQPWYTVASDIMFGENLAKGYPTADETVYAWLKSPGHRENLLRKEFKEMGVGVYKYNGYYYVSQEFSY